MAENRPFLDFKEIKQRVTIADVLPRYQVNLVRVNQTALKGTCPLPSHSSGSKNTFFVNVEKSVWYCHSDSCKKNGNRAGGNVIDFVAAMEQCSAYAAAKRIDEMFPAGNGEKAKSAHRRPDAGASDVLVNPQEADAASVPGGNNKPLAFALKDVNPSHPMIQDRGISIKTAEHFGVGFFPGKGSMAGRIVFPLHEDGNASSAMRAGRHCRSPITIRNGFSGRDSRKPSSTGWTGAIRRSRSSSANRSGRRSGFMSTATRRHRSWDRR
jgi:DNA primase